MSRLEEINEHMNYYMGQADELHDENLRLKESNNNMVKIAENRLKQIRDLQNQVEELEKEIEIVKDKWNVDAAKRTMQIGGLTEKNNRYEQTLEVVAEELKYAKITSNPVSKEEYIKNSIRFIEEALEESE